MRIRDELAQYLGKDYQPHKLNWPSVRLQKMLDKYGDLTSFERKDKESLYLHAWRADQEWWLQHLTFFREIVPPTSTVLEVHAAVGGFGLRLMDDYGYPVVFADEKTKCTPFLNWRLKQRGLKATVYKLDDAPVQDAVMAFECVHRYDDGWEFVQRLAELGGVVVLDLDNRREGTAELMEQIGKHYQTIVHKTVNVSVELLAFRASATEAEV